MTDIICWLPADTVTLNCTGASSRSLSLQLSSAWLLRNEILRCWNNDNYICLCTVCIWNFKKRFIIGILKLKSPTQTLPTCFPHFPLWPKQFVAVSFWLVSGSMHTSLFPHSFPPSFLYWRSEVASRGNWLWGWQGEGWTSLCNDLQTGRGISLSVFETFTLCSR